MQHVSNSHSYPPAGGLSELVEEWIVPDFPCLESILVHVPSDAMIGILQNDASLCCYT